MLHALARRRPDTSSTAIRTLLTSNTLYSCKKKKKITANLIRQTRTNEQTKQRDSLVSACIIPRANHWVRISFHRAVIWNTSYTSDASVVDSAVFGALRFCGTVCIRARLTGGFVSLHTVATAIWVSNGEYRICRVRVYQRATADGGREASGYIPWAARGSHR